nr:MAG TPA: hypothetical protein [Caudoviricetes sp.]
MGDATVPHTPSWHKGTRAAALSPLETPLPETGDEGRGCGPRLWKPAPEDGGRRTEKRLKSREI